MNANHRFGLADAYWFQEGPGLRNWQFTSSGIKILNVGNIMSDGSIDLSRTDRHISEAEFARKYSRFRVDAGDLVMASSGVSFDNDGMLRTKVAFVADEHLPLCMNTSTIRFKAKAGLSDLRYLRHWLQSDDFRRQVSRLVTGSAQLNFGPGHLKQMAIRLPSIDEQQRVAAILDKADALRQNRKRAIALLDGLTRSLFIETFGDPVKNPRKWAKVRLGDRCVVGSSKRVFASEFVETGVPFYRGTEVGKLATGEQFEPDLYISNEHYDALVRASDRPEPGDLLLPSICHDGRVWRVDDSKFYFKDGRVLWIKLANSKFDGEFLRQQLSDLFVGNYAAIASGTTFAELKIVNLSNLLVLCPPLHLQVEFARKTSLIRVRQAALGSSQVVAEALFASLQHRAFSGQL